MKLACLTNRTCFTFEKLWLVLELARFAWFEDLSLLSGRSQLNCDLFWLFLVRSWRQRLLSRERTPILLGHPLLCHFHLGTEIW